MPASLSAEASSKDEPEKKKKKLQKQLGLKVKKKSQVLASTYFSLWAKCQEQVSFTFEIHILIICKEFF